MSRPARVIRRLRAELGYARYAARALVGSLTAFAGVVGAGAVVERLFGASETWDRALFVSYALMFAEHLGPAPAHPAVELAQLAQPILGFVLLTEGLLRLGIQLLDRSRNPRIWMGIMAGTTRDHVILCGLGSVGFRIAEELLGMGVEVFAVERDEHGAFLDQARARGVRVLVGDARQERMLVDLNVAKARAVIAATNDDLANLEIAMDARELAKDVRVVVRLFDQKLADKVRSVLGFEASVSTSRLAAPLFASAALDPAVVGTHRVGDTTLLVVQLLVKPGAALRARTAGDLPALGVGLVALRRSGAPWETMPPSTRGLGDVDEVQLLVPAPKLAQVRALV